MVSTVNIDAALDSIGLGQSVWDICKFAYNTISNLFNYNNDNIENNKNK